MYHGAFGQIAQINDHLFLCGVMARKVDKLRHLGITSVINCTLEIANIKCPDIECVQIQVDDLPTASLSPYFERCADKIHQVHRRGGKTLVHCVAGVSRSASLVIAYLMKYQGKNLREAYYYTKARRSVIRPNVGFWKQLIDFEKRLYGGASSVKMVNSPIGFIPDVYKDETRNMMYGHGMPGQSTLGLGLLR